MNANVYFITDTKKVYQLTNIRECATKGTLTYIVSLELICAWDYTNPDYNDVQGWVSHEGFIEDVQLFTVVWYPMQETLQELLLEEGYRRIDDCPSYKRGGIDND